MLPQNSIVFEIKANMDWTSLTGRHPEELPKRRGVRAHPVCVHDGMALYVLFAAIDEKFVVLHAALETHAAGARAVGIRPPLSEEAWKLAQKRLDSGHY